MASPKRNTDFLNKQWSLDSNLLSEMSFCNVETVPLVKRAWHSSFVPVKVGMIFRRLKRRLKSTPPTCPKSLGQRVQGIPHCKGEHNINTLKIVNYTIGVQM